jgi:2-polyprenyl-3-methyl-5-hydroxy-6-metoxy-1,4-benzoquinol methylase
MANTLYSDYESRRPHPSLDFLVVNWHKRLFHLAIKKIQPLKDFTMLEIGPGHGYLARHCLKHNIEYQAIDTSPAVVQTLRSQGISVTEGELDRLNAHKSYDLLWMSHVLEHMKDWTTARETVAAAEKVLSQGGHIVIISPDINSWRQHFWEVDWSHGYQTSLRSTIQLLSDVGLEITYASHHRGGSTKHLARALFGLSTLLPHRILDAIISPSRSKRGDGFIYTWKILFAWRQVIIIARKHSS